VLAHEAEEGDIEVAVDGGVELAACGGAEEGDDGVAGGYGGGELVEVC
jgi:hypothetical protein